MDFSYKHYIRVDSENNIIKTFSSAFEQSQEGDILHRETEERHFNLDIYVYPGVLKYKYINDEIIERPVNELIIPTQPIQITTDNIVNQLSQINNDFLGFLDWYYTVHPEEP